MERQRARSLPSACEGKATQPKRRGSTFITVLITLSTWERTTLLAVLYQGHTKENPSTLARDSPAVKPPPRTPSTTMAGARHHAVELHRVGRRLSVPCRDAMALPENAAAYNREPGKRNKDLLLQRPLKATLLAALIGHSKESISDSCASHPLPQPWVLWQAGAEENTQHIHQPCLCPPPRQATRLRELRGTKK